eukprot:scaffold44083_cov20-Prasinocladus_malaysianus.AAC.2
MDGTSLTQLGPSSAIDDRYPVFVLYCITTLELMSGSTQAKSSTIDWPNIANRIFEGTPMSQCCPVRDKWNFGACLQ